VGARARDARRRRGARRTTGPGAAGVYGTYIKEGAARYTTVSYLGPHPGRVRLRRRVRHLTDTSTGRRLAPCGGTTPPESRKANPMQRKKAKTKRKANKRKAAKRRPTKAEPKRRRPAAARRQAVKASESALGILEALSAAGSALTAADRMLRDPGLGENRGLDEVDAGRQVEAGLQCVRAAAMIIVDGLRRDVVDQ